MRNFFPAPSIQISVKKLILGAGLVVTAVVGYAVFGEVRPQGVPEVEANSMYDFEATLIDGTPQPLKEFEGKVVMVVNTASRCGLTPQYEGLQSLHERFHERGFTVLGFPANDFMNQEPGTNEEIAAFCEENFGVTFPMFSKVSVKGMEMHPLFAWLIRNTDPDTEIRWNFEKFLVGRDGQPIARFEPRTSPTADEVIAAIEAALD